MTRSAAMVRGGSRRLATATLAAILLVPSLSAQTTRRTSAVEVHEATVAQLQTAMAQGRITSVELVDAYLARIAAYDGDGPALNAIIRLDPRARTEAAALDAERRRGTVRGPLHGIPIILKDNFDVAGLVTSGGSLALAGNVPGRDAFVVAKLRAAGAIVLGQSNMHELAAGITSISSLGGQTRNPYDPRRCPGGSSGGTAAAVAASFAAVGWGSDTCGSIRIPAAYNNLVGLRPTQGMVSGAGVMPLAHSQDIAGPLARTVTDLAIALDVTIGADEADPGTRVLNGRRLPRFVDSLSAGALRGARLGILTNYLSDTDREIADTVRAATRAMQASGAEIVEVNIPGFESLLAGSSVINHEFNLDLLDYLGAHPAAGVASLTEILARGLHHDALKATFERRAAVRTRDSDAYRAALAKRSTIQRRIVSILDSLQLDALVYPTMRQPPTFVGEPQVGTTCALAAQSGLPALSAPAGFTANGLPVGIELIGRPWADARLVALAYAFEQAAPRRRAPSTTPPLVNGRAPAPTTMATVARAGAAVARTSFVFDPMRNELRYDTRISGAASDRVRAVVLLRGDSASAGHVVYRLSGPEAMSATGTLFVDTINRRALLEGRLSVALFTSDVATGEGRAVLRVPQ